MPKRSITESLELKFRLKVPTLFKSENFVCLTSHHAATFLIIRTPMEIDFCIKSSCSFRTPALVVGAPLVPDHRPSNSFRLLLAVTPVCPVYCLPLSFIIYCQPL